ncbi:MAG: hypothetical protein LW723_13415 [Pseudanabaena sp. 42896M_M3]|nr:hypothetical protein [Pseudanabaena sp. 42896M_M3]
MAERSSAIFWVLCPKQSLHCYSTAIFGIGITPLLLIVKKIAKENINLCKA